MRKTTFPLNDRLTVLVVRGLIALSLMLVLNSRCSAADNDGCSDATLRGDYGFTILGDQPNPDGTTSPVVGVAITHFDGAGKLTQKDFTVDGGVPSPANGNAATGFHFAGGETGTYSVNSDCTGSAEIDLNAPAPPGLSRGVIKLMFIVPADGATIHTVVSEITAPFTTAPLLNTTRSDASRIGGIAGHCRNATLKGDFGSTILGTSPNPDGTTSPLKGVAIAEFDGRGKFTQRDFVMTGGLPEPGTGDAQTGFSFSNGETGSIHRESRLYRQRRTPSERPGSLRFIRRRNQADVFIITNNGLLHPTLVYPSSPLPSLQRPRSIRLVVISGSSETE